MKNKGRSIGKLLLLFAVIGVLTLIAIQGIGKNNTGSASDIKLGLDLAGGVSITYEAVKEDPSQKEMDDTVYKLQKRVQNYSTEASVYKEGDNRITVDIPGVKDANQILKDMGRAGAIQFVDEKGNVVVDGSDIQGADAEMYQDTFGNKFVVTLQFNPEGAKKFAKATEANLGKPISIIYDGDVISSPIVSSVITDGSAMIEGQDSYEEANQLAQTIRIGALPLELSELRSNVVGAKLGAEAITSSLLAGLIGFILVIIFMIAYYRVPGVAATLALIIYITLMILSLNIFNVTLTLPGVAGIILSIGMAVDANCIIFSRMREELGTGKTVRSAIKIGFNKAISAIVDGNITTLIAAAVLWMLGTGTVRGFAQTLFLGIVLSLFTALLITKITLSTLYGLGLDSEKFYGIQKERKVIPFLQHRLKYFIVSFLLIGIGLGAMVVNKSAIGGIFEYGLDFVGGTSTEVTFPEKFNTIENVEVEELVRGVIDDPTVETSKVEGKNTYIIRTKELTVDQRVALEDAFVSEYEVDPELILSESISATVSSEMRNDAMVAVLVATAAMLLYIWIRFKNMSFGIAAVIPLIHDVLIVLMVYAVARISVGSTFIACMLTIVGYSINDTIVTFDRIRENLKEMLKKETLEDVVNNSITQTLTRSISTSLTTFFMVFTLFLFGVESLKIFAAPLLAGIIIGTYSSIGIAGSLWYMLYRKIKKESEAV